MAGWIAAGSCGVLATPLQSLLVWSLLIVIGLLVRPRFGTRGLMVLALVVATLLLTPRILGTSPSHLTFTVAALLGLIALGEPGLNRRVLLLSGLSVLALGLLHLARLQIPWLWILGDRFGDLAGRLAGVWTERPLDLGASFAGFDFLFAMGVFCVGICMWTRSPRLGPGVFAAACILLAHAVFLSILTLTPRILESLPPVATPGQESPYVPPDFCWSTVAQQLVPWNLPALCGMLQAFAAVLIVRWTPWLAPSDIAPGPSVAARRWSLVLVVLAFLLPAVSTLNLSSSSLKGTTILANEQPEVDYLVPEHGLYGQQSAGMFGLLPDFVRSLGGQFRTASTLTAERLEDVDLLLLLHPSAAFAKERDLIWQYVRDGGSVLIATQGFDPQISMGSAAGELVRETSIAVRADAATSATEAWQESHLISSHSAVTAAGLPRTRFLSDFGASLDISWGAHPLVVGRWGWSAPQQGAGWSESRPLRTGQKLGDLVLAAAQPVGRGNMVVLGDSWPLTNEGLVKGYAYTGNILAGLVNRSSGAETPWRQVLALVLAAAILVILMRQPSVAGLVSVAVVLAVVSVAACAWSRQCAQVIPDGRLIAEPQRTPPESRIAYIDCSHLEGYDFEEWGFDGINGMALNLMRNGYLPLLARAVSREYLDRAGMFIAIAPHRAFTPSERAAVRSLVERGGIFICMVGAEEASASATLLADFGLRVPVSPVPTAGEGFEPEPMGRTRAWYLMVEPSDAEAYRAGMRLYAAWPVESLDGQAEVIAYGHNQLRVVDSDTELPVVLARPYGRGTVVLIGDSGFALNKNLEYIGGEPFAGDYENAHFWRWLLTRLSGRSEWVPPPPDDLTESGEEP